MKRILQFILAVILACFILVIMWLIAPYAAMRSAWAVVAGEEASE